ncbi:zinc finger protein-domain-containing protein [Colletotrichum godetiae]|uniref:Zinc finger protein-domain-containing protein n=1 Tax=Colletotrichum godetiae TaxID=1209918 RepID=A0AAJ0ABZ3_9PEZI|nr:zinc finger protein-domain-containing protein [Colletotrichum godetiae]KAK1670992.1 zinc finger protein-domain-containing protein [Colletotrichum godetiae]
MDSPTKSNGERRDEIHTASLAKSQGAVETLSSYLSLQTILDPCSLLRLQEGQIAERRTEELEHIGEGFCATIYDFGSTGQVIKQAKESRKLPELLVDYVAHRKIYAAGLHMAVQVCIPRPAEFINPEKLGAWYKENRESSKLPDNRSLVSRNMAILVSERIPALPLEIRNAIIEVFCPKEQRVAARAIRRNNNCLARLYLGRRRQNTRVEGGFELRNFEMTLDKLEILNLDPLQYVAPMAEALAVMHWETKHDAFDVEFVLASSPRPTTRTAEWASIKTTREPVDGSESHQKSVQVWLLDFNQVGEITMDNKGVGRAVRGFWDNDPYYPRPATEEDSQDTTEAKLWRKFKQVYLATSAKILKDNTLAKVFIKAVELEGKKRLICPPVLQGPPRASTTISIPLRSAGKKKQRSYVDFND